MEQLLKFFFCHAAAIACSAQIFHVSFAGRRSKNGVVIRLNGDPRFVNMGQHDYRETLLDEFRAGNGRGDYRHSLNE